MESKNVWQQILGGNIWGTNSFEWKKNWGGGGEGGGKMGNNFFLKQLFLRGNFGDQVLEERFL